MPSYPLMSLTLLAAALGLAGCQPSAPAASSAPAAPSAAPAAAADLSACKPGDMPTHTPGVLTIATDDPAYAPWFVGNDPANGQGFESAVAYAVAQQMGYPADKVKWVKVPFNAAVSPAPKAFDFDINQFSISAERQKVVDFSTPYYAATQVVVGLQGGALKDVKAVADLTGAKLGAQVGTTSLIALRNGIKPSSPPAVFDTNDLAVAALKAGQVDGIVVDLPTAFYMTGSDQLGGKGLIVGQIPSGAAASGDSADDPFGLLLEKGSAMTPCVSQAVDALRAAGTLDKLAGRWLTQQGAPIL
ncbi:transporter substrate-binding domain-containing protein [Amphibiibacter pelophylacis]|uniref:Transporter substrate-binding domain-containing protein n=1 Tax=Amphibiibacter pelophylacis TaxID=1799477 RepID=A0ACC6P3T9_9BURK